MRGRLQVKWEGRSGGLPSPSLPGIPAPSDLAYTAAQPVITSTEGERVLTITCLAKIPRKDDQPHDAVATLRFSGDH